MVRKEEIPARTNNGLDVFRHYLSVKWRVGRNFLNPLYADSKASCNVYYDRRSGTYKMKDFGNGDFSGDCFFLVARIKGLDCKNAADFVEVLETIDRELCLGVGDDVPPDVVKERRARLGIAGRTEEGNLPEDAAKEITKGVAEETAVPEQKPKPYQIVERAFAEKELGYWAEYGITEEVLHRYGVLSLTEYRSETAEGKAFGFTSTFAEPMFGYVGKWGVKVYRPKSEIRFVYGGHTGDSYCFGLEQLPPKGDTLRQRRGRKCGVDR